MALRPPPKPKRDRSDEFASFVPPRPRVGVMRLIEEGAARIRADIQAGMRLAGVPPKVTRKQRTRMDLRASANGEECTLRIPYCCNRRHDTTVLAHWPGLDGGRGMGMKSIDLAAAFACAACHDVVDMRAKPPAGMTREQVEVAFFRGHLRTLVRWSQMGLV